MNGIIPLTFLSGGLFFLLNLINNPSLAPRFEVNTITTVCYSGTHKEAYVNQGEDAYLGVTSTYPLVLSTPFRNK